MFTNVNSVQHSGETSQSRAARRAIVVRFPRIDYSNVPAHWTRNIAFAQDRNAASLIPTPVEPWLIRILQTAVTKLGDRDAGLRENVKAFIGQESQHFRQHRLFNKRLIAQGYPELAKFEKALADELGEFERTRSLKFLLAYADGFESLGAVAGSVWFEHSDEFLEGADPDATALWKWHMAEEFEHRSVCFDFYKALYCRGLINAVVNGYFYRIYGFVFAMRHLNGHIQRMRNYLFDIDRRSMDDAQKRRLERDMKAYQALHRRHTLPQLLKNLLPWYDPARKRTPRGLTAYLSRFEPGGDLAVARQGNSEPAA
jgi:uncharacterized protein